MKKILFIVALLALAFSSAQACEPCGEIKILPTDTLKSCSTGESKTVEVLIYNPKYCYSNITDISLSDNANFDLNRSFGDVPCGDASTLSMRGYQYCTVGVTFKPTTTSGDFATDIQVTDRDTGVHSTTVKGKIKQCCVRHTRKCKHIKEFCKHAKGHMKKCGLKNYNHYFKNNTCATRTYKTMKHLRKGFRCHRNCSKTKVNYLAGLNLVSPIDSSHIYVANNTLVFNEYFEANEGLAVVALDSNVDAITRLTFDVNQTAGLFMPRIAGDNGTYYTNDIKHTNRYGFMFPAGNLLNEINFTTWSVGFTGVVSNLSLVKISDFTEPSVVEKSCPTQTSERDHDRKAHCDRD